MESKNKIPLYLLTMNCNKKTNNNPEMVDKVVGTLPDELADLYVFGVEEFCKSIEVFFPAQSHKRLIEVGNVFMGCLRVKYATNYISFQVIGLAVLGGIGIIAITPYGLKFSKITQGKVRSGYGFSSLKGAVGLRLRYAGRTTTENESAELTFVNAHLPSGEGEYYFLQRNKTLIQIMRSLDFGDGCNVIKAGSHCFFMGDLNYRTLEKQNDTFLDELTDLISNSQDDSETLQELVGNNDELQRAKKNGEIFSGFSEGSISFFPTYKFYIGKNNYNLKRSPSWCDRILFQSTYKSPQISPLKRRNDPDIALPVVEKYDSIPELTFSDHKPVFLRISVPFQPPETMISSNGYLRILPTVRLNKPGIADDVGISKLDDEDDISGTTLIYMKATVMDRITQLYLGSLTDILFGWSMWFTTTGNGRMALLIIVLSLLFVEYFF